MPRIQRRLLLVLLGILLPAAAQTHEDGPEGIVTESSFDTEHMFGFAEGSDINEEGVTELESITIGGFGALGSYFSADNATSIKYSVTDDLRFSVGTLAEYHNFGGLPG